MIRIGEVILAKRTEKGLTQQQLANYLNVTKATISKWEKGYSYPDITLLPVLAAYFRITVDTLLNAKHEMTKEAIRYWYVQYTERFSQEPYVDVMEDMKQDQTMHYDDANFLLQLAVLSLNHVELADNPQEALTEVISVLERVEHITEDMWIRRQANVLIATTALLLKQPDITLERLASSLQPVMGEEMLLAEAYEVKGEQTSATTVMQSFIYQQLLGMIGGSTKYVRFVASDEEAFEETIQRVEAMIHAYQVESLHPNSVLQFYYTVAQISASKQNENRCQQYLKHFTRVIMTTLFPITLASDDYFTLLDEWLETLDLGSHALRDAELVRKSILQSLAHPAFEIYREEQWFQALHEQLTRFFKEEKR